MKKSAKDQPSTDRAPNKAAKMSNRGRPTAAQAPVRSERLRKIAAEMFLEFGYERTSLMQIAKRAGASKETIYSQYPNKEELFLAIVRSEVDGLRSVSSFEGDGRTLEESLTSFGFKILTGMTTGNSQLLAFLAIAEAKRFPELGRLFWVNAHERVYEGLAAFLRQEITRGGVRNEDPNLMARQLFDLLTSQVFAQAVFNVKRSMTAAEKRSQTDAAVKAFLRAYGA